ncbi:hypothetical protein MA16_Dca019055 [Dendrobium catenatum]|uniref:Uncharacterized protein n=1 Tax=Dendrobium catenatum TaxID=906689 RepID=A0A2I0W288_9ASPA|nr:hypothetical protein MA16_Dca019055 [Dendrobium catenatum]
MCMEDLTARRRGPFHYWLESECKQEDGKAASGSSIYSLVRSRNGRVIGGRWRKKQAAWAFSLASGI